MKKTTALSSRLRSLIASANVTQKDLAEAVGVKPQSISQYLDGTSNPSYSVLIAIADFFKVSTDYLLCRSNVDTNDMDVSAICSKLGLSASTVETIANNNKLIEKLINSPSSSRLLDSLKSYHLYTMGIGKDKELNEVYRLLSVQALNESSQLLGDILRAEEGENPFIDCKVSFVNGNPPPLTNGYKRIEIQMEKNEDITSAIKRYLLNKWGEDNAKR